MQIIKKFGVDRFGHETKHIGKSSSCPKIYIQHEDEKLTKKLQSEHKNKKMYHLPGKKPRLVGQIFETSDRISYNFNKVDPFSISAKKSISEAIDEASKAKKNEEPDRKFIKGSNYYLHNFMMTNQKWKSSPMHFRLTEILKEKAKLKQAMIERLKKDKDTRIFFAADSIFEKTPEKRYSSSPVNLMKGIQKDLQINKKASRVSSALDLHSKSPEIGTLEANF